MGSASKSPARWSLSKKITDKTLVRQGFSHFVRSAIREDGKSIIFEYPSGARYRVPLAYLLKWFDEPHKVKSKSYNASGEVRIERSRRRLMNYLVRVYLTDGRQYDVNSDTVLMACEPLYELYGGLTDKSKRLTEEGRAKYGSFRDFAGQGLASKEAE